MTPNFVNLRQLHNQLFGSRTVEGPVPTVNYLPDSPEVVAEDIRSVEEDIACWQSTIDQNLLALTQLAEEIKTCQGDIAMARLQMAKLRAKMARVDRRVANDCKLLFRERRRAVAKMGGAM